MVSLSVISLNFFGGNVKKVFLNFVYILVAVVLMQNIVLAQTFKFAQVTDLRLKDDSEIFEKIVKDINHTKDLEFVIFSGDNIGRATPTLLKNFLTGARKLNKPYYVSLGTKDVSKVNKMTKKTYIETVRKYNLKQPKETNFVFKKKNLVFIVVDGSKEIVPSNNGYYTPETIEWVDKQLSKLKITN